MQRGLSEQQGAMAGDLLEELMAAEAALEAATQRTPEAEREAMEAKHYRGVVNFCRQPHCGAPSFSVGAVLDLEGGPPRVASGKICMWSYYARVVFSYLIFTQCMQTLCSSYARANY